MHLEYAHGNTFELRGSRKNNFFSDDVFRGPVFSYVPLSVALGIFVCVVSRSPIVPKANDGNDNKAVVIRPRKQVRIS